MTLNRKGRPFTWSYSALSDYEGCPYRYARKRFFCDVTEVSGEAAIWGERVHKALELHLKDGAPLSPEFTPYQKWATVLDLTKGEKAFELQIALDRDRKQVSWFSKEAWGRGVVDLLIRDGRRATIVDYKTGKVKNDPTQLATFACFVSTLYPDLEEFNCRFIWLKHGRATGLVFAKQDLEVEWSRLASRVEKMELSWTHENFPCNPSGLCRGWCPVTDCLHYEEKRR